MRWWRSGSIPVWNAVGWLVGWSLTSFFSTNTAISDYQIRSQERSSVRSRWGGFTWSVQTTPKPTSAAAITTFDTQYVHCVNTFSAPTSCTMHLLWPSLRITTITSQSSAIHPSDDVATYLYRFQIRSFAGCRGPSDPLAAAGDPRTAGQVLPAAVTRATSQWDDAMLMCSGSVSAADGSRSAADLIGNHAARDSEQNNRRRPVLFVRGTEIVKSQIPLRYLVADRSEAGRRPASSC